MQDVKRIESYGLYDFCQDIEAAFKEGYVFDFDTNENFPTAYGTMLTCGLVKAGKKVETAANTGVVAKDVQTEEIVQEFEQVTEEVEKVTTEVEEVVQEVAEVPEAAPAKRGPKPKNK
jgi:hypothetical protein